MLARTVVVLLLALVLMASPGALAAPPAAGAEATAKAESAKKKAKKKRTKARRCRTAAKPKRKSRARPKSSAAATKKASKKKKKTRPRCKRAKKKRKAPAAPAVPPPPPPKPPRLSPEAWQDLLSEARYRVGDPQTVYISARDGTQLSLTVHLPIGTPAGAKLPTLMQMTPYRPLDQALGGYASYLFFVERGAAYVEADERGTGGSEGCLDFGGSADRSDAQVFAEWIRAQPWSNGRIVTDGVSHPGMGSVVGHAAIPQLTGALAHAPVVSYYQDEWLQGAKFEDQFNGPAYQGIEDAPPLPPSFADPNALKAQAATCTGQTTLDFTPYEGPFTDLWADRDLSRFPPAERKPILLTHGFVDVNVHPDHSQLYWDALPDDYPKYAVFGWWYHGYPVMPDSGFDLVRHRWMDALLFGTDNGLAAEPRVLVQDSKGKWHEGENWPLEPSEHVRLYTAAGGVLANAAGAPASAEYPDAPGAERGAWEAAHVAFRSEPLGATRLVNGAPKVHLVGSSSATSTKWVAYLLDEAPDGTWQRISHGYADSHIWQSESTWTDMVPGTAYRWTLELQPTAAVVEAGHRITLLIASQDSRNTKVGSACFDDHTGGCYEPSGIAPAVTAGRATNTVHAGEGGTSVELDWVDPGRTRTAPFPAPE